MDFLVHTTKPCAFDAEIRSLGSRIIPCLNPSRPWQYVPKLRGILRQDGPYDVVHSHIHHFSGVTLWAAALEGVPVRIAHSHSDTRREKAASPLGRRAYLKMMKGAISRYASVKIGCSRAAGAALFGEDWLHDNRHRLVYCGIDVKPFRQELDPEKVRRELAIPTNAFVIGHVGRFTPAKNHKYIIDIAAELLSWTRDAHFLLVGDGSLRLSIQKEIASRGLMDHFTLTGARDDIPRLMMNAMDIMIMPSLYEGLPLVGIEAQASGLPLIVSDNVTPEVDVIHSNIRRLPLSGGPQTWASEICLLRSHQRIPVEDAVGAIRSSSFDIRSSVAQITSIYRGK